MNQHEFEVYEANRKLANEIKTVIVLANYVVSVAGAFRAFVVAVLISALAAIWFPQYVIHEFTFLLGASVSVCYLHYRAAYKLAREKERIPSL